MDAIAALRSSLAELLSARDMLADHRDSIDVAIDNVTDRIVSLRVTIAIAEKTGGAE